jgi:outer membrane lipoprotein-sorting protein
MRSGRWKGPPDRTRAAAAGARGAALLALLATAACVRRAPPPDLAADPAALLAQVEATQAKVVSVRGEARVRVDSPSGSGTVTMFVAAARPDRVRLDTLDFFGNAAGVLVADGGRFSLLDLREGVFLRGAATPENLARLLPLALPADELVLLLCGAVPIAPGRPVAVEAGDGVALLTVEGDGARQRLDVGPGAAVHASTIAGGAGSRGGAAYRASFGRFEERAGRPFPGEVRLEGTDGKVKVKLSWKEIEPNAVLPEGGFTLAPPPGVRIVDLDTDR